MQMYSNCRCFIVFTSFLSSCVTCFKVYKSSKLMYNGSHTPVCAGVCLFVVNLFFPVWRFLVKCCIQYIYNWLNLFNFDCQAQPLNDQTESLVTRYLFFFFFFLISKIEKCNKFLKKTFWLLFSLLRAQKFDEFDHKLAVD